MFRHIDIRMYLLLPSYRPVLDELASPSHTKSSEHPELSYVSLDGRRVPRDGANGHFSLHISCMVKTPGYATDIP